MKGTILDFLKLAAEKPELAKELAEVAAKHDFEFTDEVSDEELEGLAGGGTYFEKTLGTSSPVGEAAKEGASSAKELWRMATRIIAENADRDLQEEQDVFRE
jgi:hypothetical protein